MIATTSSHPLPRERERSGLGPAGLRFRSILVATDCSPASATAVRLAARLAKQFHARLHVLHAMMPELYAVDTEGPAPDLALLDLVTARETLHKYALRIPELRTVVHEEIVFVGSAADGIESTGKSHDIDLLVLGSHGRQGLAKLAMGSVAEWAIGRLHYPVLVTGPACDKSFRPFQSIVLGTDLGDPSLRAAQYAGSLAEEFQARLTMVNVLPATHTAKEHAGDELSATRKLQALLSRECEDSCTLKFDVRTGAIAPAILQSARENKANLIVLGAPRRARLADHLPRTKLSEVIREARCPVLLVPAHSS
jgi:nucleotide-binding universal stress UspA family protein